MLQKFSLTFFLAWKKLMLFKKINTHNSKYACIVSLPCPGTNASQMLKLDLFLSGGNLNENCHLLNKQPLTMCWWGCIHVITVGPRRADSSPKWCGLKLPQQGGDGHPFPSSLWDVFANAQHCLAINPVLIMLTAFIWSWGLATNRSSLFTNICRFWYCLRHQGLCSAQSMAAFAQRERGLNAATLATENECTTGGVNNGKKNFQNVLCHMCPHFCPHY